MWQNFQVGCRAQVPSLPVDDPLTGHETGVYFAYTFAGPDQARVAKMCLECMVTERPTMISVTWVTDVIHPDT